MTDTILQGTPIDLESQKQTIWEGNMPVVSGNWETIILDEITNLSVNNKPKGILILPLFDKTVSNNGNTQSSATIFSSHSSGALLQGNAPLILQGDASTGNFVNLFVNTPSADVKLSIPTLTNDATFLIDNLLQTITNKTISGADNTLKDIPNSALANPTIKINPGTGISVNDTSIDLGETLTITSTGVVSEADTLSSVVSRGATTDTAVTLSNAANNITTGSLTATGGTINGMTIGVTNAATGIFTTINGLGITNNGSNALNIAAGKTVTLNNTLTFDGTDGTILMLPNISDILVGTASSQTLTNKTLAAGTNNISGLTSSNFSSANISQWTNNSSFITASTTDTLTNKTLTAPVINGIVTTSGLTLPTFTAAGNIDQSGSSSTFSTGTGIVSINGDATVSANKTFSITTADKLLVAGSIVPQTVTITVPLLANLLDQNVFVADNTYQLTAVRCVYSVGALISGTLQVTVETGTNAPGTGTNQLTSTINLSTTVNTVYSGTIIGTPTTISAGNKVSIDVSGTLTGLLGTCTLTLKRV